MKKMNLTPFGKRFLSFLAAGIFLNGGASIYKHTIGAQEENTKRVVDTIEIFNNNLDKNKVEQLEITQPRNSQGRYTSYTFNPKQTLQKLSAFTPIFYEYKTKINLFMTDEEKKEYDNTMRTIFDLNIEFVEIENRAIKEEIAPELNVPADDINILYELSNLSDSGYVTLSVDNQYTHYKLSNELNNKITQYKKHILLTQGIDYDSLSTSEKEDIVSQVLNNISSSREYLIDYLVKNDIQFDNSELEVVSANSSTTKSTSSKKEDKLINDENER